MARPGGRRSRARGATEDVIDSSPSRYIARVSTETGRELHDGIEPWELLVHAHRDNHPVEVAAQFLASRMIQLTGREALVRRGLRFVNGAAAQVADLAGAAVGSDALARAAKRLVGVTDRDYRFHFRETTHLSEAEVKRRTDQLQHDAAARLKARGPQPRLRVLLTGATGFLGKEILFQVATDRRVEEIVAVLRPETVRDPKTKEVVRVLSPAERGALLLQRLKLPKAAQKKYRFVAGDIEQPGLGIAAEEVARLRDALTHVVHCAASVSFDDTYENSFRANVLGSRNALAFALELQEAEGSPFVQHIAIETSYIHGRQKASFAAEESLAFPRHFYNNYYELTKAMASIETDRFMIERGLRVAQLLPSIVIGDSRTGNNRGDTKVVNAPINAFGRAQEALSRPGQTAGERVRGWAVAQVAQGFPGDPSAELNLVPVDRVVEGILAALTVPEAIGNRIHLATDNRIRSQDMLRICREELDVAVRLTDPTIYRNLTLPLVRATLEKLGEPKLANALEKLGTIFGGYSEWGQPIHKVGNDVRILGLALRRPNTEHAFRMLCRHNRYVQDFGKVRDADEIARRERLWDELCTELELETGHEVGAIEPAEFRALLREKLDVVEFVRRPARPPARRRKS
ncbi:MAG: SDR family oxidoreductase [Vicinamibacteria bacterium]|nr:SDR family oxidoreductase [Vicinamibacteria bacterium]